MLTRKIGWLDVYVKDRVLEVPPVSPYFFVWITSTLDLNRRGRPVKYVGLISSLAWRWATIKFEIVPTGLYYGVTISLVSFATGLSVVTLNIHHRGMRGRGVSPMIKKIVFGVLAKALWIHLDIPDGCACSRTKKVHSRLCEERCNSGEYLYRYVGPFLGLFLLP